MTPSNKPRKPSVKTLVTRLRIEVGTAKAIRAAIDAAYDDETRCHFSFKVRDALTTVSKLIDACGYEFADDRYEKGIGYVNVGDQYTDTVLYDYKSRTWRCCCVYAVMEFQARRFR